MWGGRGVWGVGGGGGGDSPLLQSVYARAGVAWIDEVARHRSRVSVM